MALNFRFICHKHCENLHIKLMGDFDGSSAYELINALEKYNGNAGKVFVDTCSLLSVHPFGLDVFQKNCAVKKLLRALTFTGEYGNRLAAHGSVII